MALVLSGTDGVSGVDGTASNPSYEGTDSNTGIFYPAADTVAIGTGGTERLRVDSAGNAGLGVTPSAWGSTAKAFTVRSTGSGIEGSIANSGATNAISLVNNGYYNSGWKYVYSGGSFAAGRYDIEGAQHSWHTAPSGAAGNAITFTQAMTLDASGYLLVGATSSVGVGASRLQLGSSGASSQILLKNSTGHAAIYSVGTESYWTTASGGFLAFGQAPADGSTFTERARITSDGNLLVGKTSSNDNVVGSMIRGTGYFTSTWAETTNAITTYHVYSTGTGGYRFYVGLGGTVFAVSTTISAVSDQRLKENIQDLDVGLDAVMALKPRKFDWKEGQGKDIKGDRGFIAQEFETVFPDLIDEWRDPAPEGEEPYKSVRQDLIPVLVKAIQELNAKVEALAAEIAQLKGTT